MFTLFKSLAGIKFKIVQHETEDKIIADINSESVHSHNDDCIHMYDYV